MLKLFDIHLAIVIIYWHLALFIGFHHILKTENSLLLSSLKEEQRPFPFQVYKCLSRPPLFFIYTNLTHTCHSTHVLCQYPSFLSYYIDIILWDYHKTTWLVHSEYIICVYIVYINNIPFILIVFWCDFVNIYHILFIIILIL